MKKYILITFLITIASCKKQKPYLHTIKASKIEVTNKAISSKKIDSFIEPYKKHIKKEMNIALSYASTDLTSFDGLYETSLGNLLADLCYKKANPIFNKKTGKNIDFALFNHGGIRASIYKGKVTKQHAFNLMPFENYLVVAEISYQKLVELVAYLKEENKAHPLSKHISLQINASSFLMKINNLPINKKDTFFVLTSDYLQHGGDNMNFFKNPIKLYSIDYKMRQAIIDYFKETDTLKTSFTKRLIIKK